MLRDVLPFTAPLLPADSALTHSSRSSRSSSSTRNVSKASSGARVHARVFFGCQTSESGKFRRQQADGILGLQADDHQASPRSSRVPSVLRALVEQLRSVRHHTHARALTVACATTHMHER